MVISVKPGASCKEKLMLFHVVHVSTCLYVVLRCEERNWTTVHTLVTRSPAEMSLSSVWMDIYGSHESFWASLKKCSLKSRHCSCRRFLQERFKQVVSVHRV